MDRKIKIYAYICLVQAKWLQIFFAFLTLSLFLFALTINPETIRTLESKEKLPDGKYYVLYRTSNGLTSRVTDQSNLLPNGKFLESDYVGGILIGFIGLCLFTMIIYDLITSLKRHAYYRYRWERYNIRFVTIHHVGEYFQYVFDGRIVYQSTYASEYMDDLIYQLEKYKNQDPSNFLKFKN